MREETAEQPAPLRSGLTTGSCVTATSLAAARLLLGGETNDAVQIVLPTNAKLTTESLLDLHLSAGGQNVRGLDFGLSLTGTTTPTPKPPRPAPPPNHPKPRLSAADAPTTWPAAVDSVFGG